MVIWYRIIISLKRFNLWLSVRVLRLIGFPVVFVKEVLDVVFPVQDFSTEKDVWENTVVPVFLQGAAADMELFGNFTVGQITVALKRWRVTGEHTVGGLHAFPDGLHEEGYRFAFEGQDVIIHVVSFLLDWI